MCCKLHSAINSTSYTIFRYTIKLCRMLYTLYFILNSTSYSILLSCVGCYLHCISCSIPHPTHSFCILSNCTECYINCIQYTSYTLILYSVQLYRMLYKLHSVGVCRMCIGCSSYSILYSWIEYKISV